MNISQITGVYFSPTGSTKRVTEWLTEGIAENKEAEWLDLTDAVSSSRSDGYSPRSIGPVNARFASASMRRIASAAPSP